MKPTIFSRIRGLSLLAWLLLTAGAILVLPYAKAGIEILTSLPGSGQRSELRPADLAEVRGDRIVVPSIDLDSPLADDLSQLDHKVVRYSFSARPGEGGNVVVTAHNLRKQGNPLFSLLFLVRSGSEVALVYQGKKYVYEVRTKEIVSPREAERFAGRAGSEKLTLITCYPPTIDTMRLVVTAERKDNTI